MIDRFSTTTLIIGKRKKWIRVGIFYDIDVKSIQSLRDCEITFGTSRAEWLMDRETEKWVFRPFVKIQA